MQLKHFTPQPVAVQTQRANPASSASIRDVALLPLPASSLAVRNQVSSCCCSGFYSRCTICVSTRNAPLLKPSPVFPVRGSRAAECEGGVWRLPPGRRRPDALPPVSGVFPRPLPLLRVSRPLLSSSLATASGGARKEMPGVLPDV